MRERYGRRMERFNQLDARSQPVLFVRSAATTEKILRAAELVDVLMARFGREARLLMVLNFQEKTTGAAFVQGLPNLMFYYLSPDVHRKTHPEFDAPFAGPVRCALDWAVGRQVEAARLDGVRSAWEAADADSSGCNGLGGLDSFDPEPSPMPAHAGVRLSKMGMQIVRYPPAQGTIGRVPVAINSLHVAQA